MAKSSTAINSLSRKWWKRGDEDKKYNLFVTLHMLYLLNNSNIEKHFACISVIGMSNGAYWAD